MLYQLFVSLCLWCTIDGIFWLMTYSVNLGGVVVKVTVFICCTVHSEVISTADDLIYFLFNACTGSINIKVPPS